MIKKKTTTREWYSNGLLGTTTCRNSGTMEDQTAPITADHQDINGAAQLDNLYHLKKSSIKH